MNPFFRAIFAIVLLMLSSCDPDEDLSNSDDTSNNGNVVSNGNATSYPEIINLLAGDWYGVSHEKIWFSGDTNIYPQNTENVGYLSFGSENIGVADFDFPDGFIDPTYSSLQVSKYSASVTITNGSWSGQGPEYLRLSGSHIEFAKESNFLPEKSYCIVEHTTPFYDINTPTIQYGILTGGWLFSPSTDITLFNLHEDMRIHTLNSTTLKLVRGIDNSGYFLVTYTKL